MVSDASKFCLALNLIEGVGAKTMDKLIERFGSVEAVWGASASELQSVPGIKSSVTREILDRSLPERLETELALLETNQIRFVTRFEPSYPDSLRQIADPPNVLYWKGCRESLAGPCVAIVGSRKASRHGLRSARALAQSLAQRGVTVVSGMALGIDAAAHAGALEGGGRTVAVMAGGLGDVYPHQNRSLAEKALAAGAWVSEFPIGMSPRPQFFPHRNRIISGLSKAVVVVEANEASGSLITAAAALEQGKDVMAVPGNTDIPTTVGSNRLIRDGAGVVLGVEDILRQIGMDCAPQASLALPAALSEEETSLLVYLNDEKVPYEQILHHSGFTSGKAAALLMKLETKGWVRQWPGQYYTRIKYQ